MDWMEGSPTEPHRLLAGLAHDGVSLDLSTLDVCFLAGLSLRAERDGLASLDEELVVDTFEQVCDLVEPGADNKRKRATHAIQRLRDQRLLARVDATGIVSAGEYALTSLGTAIVQSFLEDEKLTRESLALLTRAVISSLAEIQANAQRATGEEAWRARVVTPLRIAVGDLVGGIERRQRGLDAQQEQVQTDIRELLQADWFGAVERCEALLDEVAGTLRELNEVLLHDASDIQARLQDIQQAAAAAGAAEAEEAAQRVADHVDRVAAWGRSRQETWSQYYRYVHRYLRDVVRLDPDRALSQRLLEQIRAWPARPFSLVAAADGHIRLLRPAAVRWERPPVARPSGARERELEPATAEQDDVDLEALVREALSAAPESLAAVTRRVLAGLDQRERYAAAGRITAVVARLATPRPARPRPWVPVTGELEIEDWTLTRAREEP